MSEMLGLANISNTFFKETSDSPSLGEKLTPVLWCSCFPSREHCQADCLISFLSTHAHTHTHTQSFQVFEVREGLFQLNTSHTGSVPYEKVNKCILNG